MTPRDTLRQSLWPLCQRYTPGELHDVVRELCNEVVEPPSSAPYVRDPADDFKCPSCSSDMHIEQRDDSGRSLRERLLASERATGYLLVEVERRGAWIRACARRKGCAAVVQEELALEVGAR